MIEETSNLNETKNNGVIVAVLGADGSGKSTLARHLVAALDPVAGARHFYFGSGDGPPSWFRWPLKRIRDWLDPPSTRKVGPPALTKKRTPVGSGFKAIWALTLALEKRQKSRQAKRVRAEGLIAICDRFPQLQIPGTNDGLLLADWTRSDSKFLRLLARLERRGYEAAVRVGPDLVIHLDLTVEIAQGRRSGLDSQYLQSRIDLVRGLDFGAPVLRIDASQPEKVVLGEAMTAIMSLR